MCIPSIGHGVNQLRQKFSHSVGLPIRDALPAATIEAMIRSDGVPSRRCLLDPVVTIWAFLSQVLDTDRCCRKAMSRVWAYLAESTPVPLGAADTAADTGAYCKARQRLGVSRKIMIPCYPGLGSMWTNHLAKRGNRAQRSSNAAMAFWVKR